MNIQHKHLFLIAIAANVVGGLLLIGIMACHGRMRHGQWKLGDGY
jgi:hypothetical protein